LKSKIQLFFKVSILTNLKPINPQRQFSQVGCQSSIIFNKIFLIILNLKLPKNGKNNKIKILFFFLDLICAQLCLIQMNLQTIITLLIILGPFQLTPPN
jgi:hypothetical protein